MPLIVLLGPQRFRPTLASVLDSLDVRGPLAVVSAGWQERERELDELRDHCGREVVNLELYDRAERVLAEDPELAAALRDRQEALQRLQNLYRIRLDHLLEAARDMMAWEPAGPFVREHRRAAIRAVRTLDRQHLTRLRQSHGEFEARWLGSERSSVARQRDEIRKSLDPADALAIAGGHVAVLLNRMRLFGLLGMVGDRPIVAWSAGAMALSERVVLFHDNPPQGAGNPEVLDAGLRAYTDIVPLPHARQRLELDNPVRVALFARRFSPASSVVLEGSARVDWDGEHWHASPGTRRLGRGGNLMKMVGT